MDLPLTHTHFVSQLEDFVRQIQTTGMCLVPVNYDYRKRPVYEGGLMGSHIRNVFKELGRTPIIGAGGHRHETWRWFDGKRIKMGEFFTASLVIPHRKKFEPLLAPLRLLDLQPVGNYGGHPEVLLLEQSDTHPFYNQHVRVITRKTVTEVTWQGLKAEPYYRSWRKLVLEQPECRRALGLPNR